MLQSGCVDHGPVGYHGSDEQFQAAVETQVLVPLIQLVAGQELAAFTAMLRRALPDAVLVPGEEELPAAWTRKLTVAPVKGLERMQAKAREYIEVSAASAGGRMGARTQVIPQRVSGGDADNL